MTRSTRTAHDAAPSARMRTDEQIRRVGGVVAVLGGIGMLTSAALMYSTGADIFTASAEHEMAGYLARAEEHRGLLELHLLLWIGCAGALCLALHLFAQTSPRSVSALVARFATAALAGLGIVFFSGMFGVVDGYAGTSGHEPGAQALATASVMADDITTLGILGLGVIATLVSGRGTWVPRGLAAMIWPLGLLAMLYALPIEPLTTIAGTAIVPVGIGTIIAMGIVGIRG